jgi:hypothetical protein
MSFKSNSYKLNKYLKKYKKTSEQKYLNKVMYYLQGGEKCPLENEYEYSRNEYDESGNVESDCKDCEFPFDDSKETNLNDNQRNIDLLNKFQYKRKCGCTELNEQECNKRGWCKYLKEDEHLGFGEDDGTRPGICKSVFIN